MNVQQANINHNTSALTNSMHVKNVALDELKKPKKASLNKASESLTGSIVFDIIGAALGLPPGIMEALEVLDNIRSDKKPEINIPEATNEANKNSLDLIEEVELTSMFLKGGVSSTLNLEGCAKGLTASHNEGPNTQQQLEARKIEQSLEVENKELEDRQAKLTKLKNS